MTTDVTVLTHGNMAVAPAAGIPLRSSAGGVFSRPSDRSFDYQVMLQLTMFLGN